nr:MAG TPA: protein of unknown function (DUF883) [Inoviridae sp.]
MDYWRWLSLAFLLGFLVGRMTKRVPSYPDGPILRTNPRSIKHVIYNPRGFRSKD